ncbi:MAG: InlB B-repeat-containing protein [Bacilli bacterium]|nr:InlB B-repeat-containing protein [Bacilli bacterium]
MKNTVLPILLSALLLSSCGGGNSATPSSSASPTSSQTPSATSSVVPTAKATVTFANTTMSPVTVDIGSSLNKPSDPSKENCLFAGWYLDKECTKEATFPIKISGNMTIYALFYTYQEAFAKARKNTIGEEVVGYEYDYEIKVTAGYMNTQFEGNTGGNTKYVKETSDISFYDEHTNSGALFYDGSKYQIKKGSDLHKVSVDSKGVVKKYDISKVDGGYKYDSSSFAKALFEYDESKLRGIRKSNKENEYVLETAYNFSNVASIIGNYVNHPIVESIVGNLPETSVNSGMYVSFSGNKVDTYRYEMKVDVSGVQFNLTYDLTFKNVGKAPSISPKVFQNTFVSEADIASSKGGIKENLTTYKTNAHSSYDFDIKTAVDFPNKLAIDAHVDGFTKRKVDGNDVFYLNDYEVDSDLKNADLYKSAKLSDAHGARVKLANKEVYDLKKKLLGGYSEVAKVEREEAIDDYYFLDVLDQIEVVSFIQTRKEEKTGVTSYQIGSTDASSIKVLDYFNSNIRIDPLKEASKTIYAFGEFDKDSVAIKEFNFAIGILNGAIKGLSLFISGSMDACYPESAEFSTKQVAAFKLTFSLTMTEDGSSYEPASKIGDVK